MGATPLNYYDLKFPLKNLLPKTPTSPKISTQENCIKRGILRLAKIE
jgi:hypothetical protein